MQPVTKYPLVTIILPTYNRGEFILSSIASIRAQSYSQWELLVVDDTSEDNTMELVQAVNDPRIRYLNTGKRLGIVGTRNEGIRNASGSFIAFIDSDDLWDAAKLEKQVGAMHEYPDAAFSLTGGYNFREAGEPVEYFYQQREGMRYGNVYVAFFKAEVAATMPTLLFRRDCLEVTGAFDESNPLADMDFIFRLAKNYRAIILYECLFYRRIHETNYSSVNWLRRQRQGLQMLKRYSKTLPAGVSRQAFFRMRINFGEQYLTHRMPARAFHQFLRAWVMKPLSMVSIKKLAKAVVSGFRS